MKPLKRVTYIFEFILAAHMVFSIIMEIQSVLFPMNLLSQMLESTPEHMKPKNPHANHNEFFDFLSFFGFFTWLTIKYFVEGFRFNTIIICGAEMFFFLDRALQYADKVLCQVSAILTIMYIYTLVSYPVYQFPEPSGKYQVGYRTFRVDDAYRTKVAVFYPTEDPVKQGLSQTQIKRLTKQIQWSPENKYTKQIYEYIISRQWITHPEWIVDFTIGHIYRLKFNCLQNAIVAKSEGKDNKYPVIILSHGLSAHLHSYTTFAKQWASEGYIVLCPQHEEMVYPWDNKGTKIYQKKNKPEDLQKYKDIRAIHLQWRTEQVGALIDHILVRAKFSEIFNQDVAVQEDCVIVWGHSFGGATAIRMAQIDKRVKGIILLDPWLFPMSKSEIQTQLPANSRALFIFKEIDSKKDDLYNKNDVTYLLEANSGKDNFLAFKLRGMDHVHPTDLSFVIPSELEFSQQLRTSNNIQLIYESVCELTTLFMTNYVKQTSKNKEDNLVGPFNNWAQAKWRSSKMLIDIN